MRYLAIAIGILVIMAVLGPADEVYARQVTMEIWREDVGGGDVRWRVCKPGDPGGMSMTQPETRRTATVIMYAFGKADKLYTNVRVTVEGDFTYSGDFGYWDIASADYGLDEWQILISGHDLGQGTSTLGGNPPHVDVAIPSTGPQTYQVSRSDPPRTPSWSGRFLMYNLLLIQMSLVRLDILSQGIRHPQSRKFHPGQCR